VGSRAGRDVLEKRKVKSLASTGIRTPDIQARSLVTFSSSVTTRLQVMLFYTSKRGVGLGPVMYAQGFLCLCFLV
jgi:hypothetical protein